MRSIRDWLAPMPTSGRGSVAQPVLHLFPRSPVEEEGLGPVAAAKVPLERDARLLSTAHHTFGVPFYVRERNLLHLDGGHPFGRLMLAWTPFGHTSAPARRYLLRGPATGRGNSRVRCATDADFFIFVPRAARSPISPAVQPWLRTGSFPPRTAFSGGKGRAFGGGHARAVGRSRELLGGTAGNQGCTGPEATPPRAPRKAGKGFSLSRDKAEHPLIIRWSGGQRKLAKGG